MREEQKMAQIFLYNIDLMRDYLSKLISEDTINDYELFNHSLSSIYKSMEQLRGTIIYLNTQENFTSQFNKATDQHLLEVESLEEVIFKC